MLTIIGAKAKQASYQLVQCTTRQKNEALQALAEAIEQNSSIILEKNQLDIKNAQQQNISASMQDRLLLTVQRLQSIAQDVRNVCLLPDPIGEIIEGRQLENGLLLQRKRTSLGVIGVIYEARPNVTIDIAALCLKTSNAVILRGGKETSHTNQALISVIQQVLAKTQLPVDAVQLITDPDRQRVTELIKLDRYVDMIIPRGGAALQRFCQENATIPVIMGGIGICHIFVDQSADIEKSLAIIKNAKVQRPTVCNAVETVLIHKAIMKDFLPQLSKMLACEGVTLHVFHALMSQLISLPANVELLLEEQLRQEWLTLDLNIVVVDSLEQAISHIREYGSGHSEAIMTTSLLNAETFVQRVDSAAVYVNTSTRFTDGAQFGLGAEVSVSTQKLHARGPMGLEALTTYKWIGYSDGLIRQ